jgi:hypothetical protein
LTAGWSRRGALAGRHERKAQSGRLLVRLIFEGCHLKTLVFVAARCLLAGAASRVAGCP